MYATGAFFLIAAIGAYVGYANNRDEPATDAMIRSTRHDIRLIAYLLAGILVMLGLIADRIH